MSLFDTGPYVLLSIVEPGGPSPSTQTWLAGTTAVGEGYGGFVVTVSPSKATILLMLTVFG